MSPAFAAVILAAGGEPGRGGEANPTLLLGRPLLRFAVDAVLGLKPGFRPPLVVSGLDASEADAGFGDSAAARVLVAPAGTDSLSRLGAARRVLRARAEDDVLVLTADLPLLEPSSLRGLLREHGRARNVLTVLTSGEDPERVLALVVSRGELLSGWNRIAAAAGGAGASLDSLVGAFVFRKKRVGAVTPGRPEEALRVSDPYDLARAAAVLKERKIRGLCRAGVTVLDPATTWIGLDVEIGAGTVVYPGTVIEGRTVVGKGGRIGPAAHIADARVGDRVRIFAATVIESATLEDDVQAGPFSRLRPHTVVRAGARVGNFVEMKKTDFGPRSKALHLSYLGDSTVEEDVNIGAGTITCNYDGVRKNPTHIEAGAFIGSGTELVAPVRVGRKAYIAAGSTITADVSDGALAIARARQVEKPGWVASRRPPKPKPVSKLRPPKP
jgi:bifunctional UDP-N-acetylglucosamine pyrophosphorylase/glucosamine-1-phosphate N-acetyltransferase